MLSPSVQEIAPQRGGLLDQLRGLLLTLRPRQWSKNFFVFAALIFSQNLFHWEQTRLALLAFVTFCFGSGVVYILNDLVDVRQDRLHPVKRRRPIASGLLSVSVAYVSLLVVGVAVLCGAWMLGVKFFAVFTAYLLMQISYCFWLKHIVIVDVFILAFGFVFRVAAGAFAISVAISPWLLICTVLLSLFLALNKRRHEIVSLEEGATGHRKVLAHYSPIYLTK